MILRSGMMKRCKRDDDDVISKLPDHLLIHILSLVPDADANRTRILSNRWKYLWVFLPNLHFVEPKLDRYTFYESVDRTLALRGVCMPIIQGLFLQCSCWCDANRVRYWFGMVKVIKQLELRFKPPGLNFSWNLLKTCNTLVELTLEGLFVMDDDMPDQWLLPCLKKLNLISTVCSFKPSFQNLISRCPALQDLCLEKLRLIHDFLLVNVSLTSLKTLRIRMGDYTKCEFTIDAPTLEYLYLEDYKQTNYVLTNPMSLVEAYISKHDHSGLQLIIRCVASARILTLDHQSCLVLLHIPDLNLSTFPNLVKLVLAWGGHFLHVLFKNMPNLEYLTFLNGLLPDKLRWNQPMEEAPACLRHKMKEIIILTHEVVPKEVTLIGYLLKHSNLLEKLKIETRKIAPEMRNQLLSIPRGSSLCQIEFV